MSGKYTDNNQESEGTSHSSSFDSTYSGGPDGSQGTYNPMYKQYFSIQVVGDFVNEFRAILPQLTDKNGFDAKFYEEQFTEINTCYKNMDKQNTAGNAKDISIRLNSAMESLSNQVAKDKEKVEKKSFKNDVLKFCELCTSFIQYGQSFLADKGVAKEAKEAATKRLRNATAWFNGTHEKAFNDLKLAKVATDRQNKSPAQGLLSWASGRKSQKSGEATL